MTDIDTNDPYDLWREYGDHNLVIDQLNAICKRLEIIEAKLEEIRSRQSPFSDSLSDVYGPWADNTTKYTGKPDSTTEAP